MPRKTFRTSDGTALSYIRAGQGKPIVMLHGWSRSAEPFTIKWNRSTLSLNLRYGELDDGNDRTMK